MMKQLHIRLIDTLKKSRTSNKLTDKLLIILSIILYPLILLFGLVIMFFAALLSLYQKTFIRKDNITLVKQVTASTEQWSILTEQDSLKIFSKYAGEVRFGPAYLNLKSDPVIPYLTDKLFGDWFFYRDKTLFLQQWKATDKPSTDLVAINTVTMELKVLQQNIPSVLWSIVEIENSILQLTCDTGQEIWKYEVVTI